MYEYPYYGNQAYGQPNMQMQNQRIPYMQNQNIMQGQQLQQFSQPIIPRVVNAMEEITANDVPMNVPYSVFPKVDLSEIYVKSWSANGTIQTVSYRPVLEQNQSEGANIPQTDFNALNEDVRALRQEISERFDRLESSMTNSKTKTPVSRTKKEAVADE